ncbi:uncharacterized protein LOC113295688 [Papaver somniferum]|uniref:uncharacterized protein LOC113295688 n=1 Tax=Papaver somniferum TaxID=3469 RepID=UPI000E6F468E|nr:uncharacterized protein LOC113295688 [Papaver somniferum]
MCLYTAFSDTAVGALLAQENDEGIERPIYYFCRILRDAELRYPKKEKECLSLIHSIQKFRHYLLSNKVVLVSKSDPAKFLLSKPVLTGRTSKWLLQMSELDITCALPRAIKGQAVADLLAAFPGEGTTGLHEDLLGEFPDISVVEEEVWLLYFDVSSTPSNNIGGAGVVLVSPTGEVFSHSFKLDFQCTNNSAEYKAFLIVLSISKQAGVTRLEIRGDSKLLVNQMNGVYALKEVIIAPYMSEAKRLLNYFADATIIHVGRRNNKHVDCLATVASKLKFEGLEETLTVKRRTIESTWLSKYKDTKICDWRTPIIQELNNSLFQGKVNLKTLQNFFMLHGMLYHRNPHGSLSRCLGDDEAQLQLNHVHNEICGQSLVVTLYRRLQLLGYYWPEMEAQSRLLQKSCSNCQAPPHQLEVFSVDHTGDWREPYISYLRDGATPASQKDAVKIKQKAKRFIFHAGILYRKSFGGDLLSWVLDIIRKINPPSSKQHEYIITATEYFTKWVEAIPLRGTTKATIAAFIKEYIICRFCVPKHIITDNGTPFVNKQVRELPEEFGIKQVFSTVYYPQGNRQAESTNKTLIRIISRTNLYMDRVYSHGANYTKKTQLPSVYENMTGRSKSGRWRPISVNPLEPISRGPRLSYQKDQFDGLSKRAVKTCYGVENSQKEVEIYVYYSLCI